jgi:murein peptide amidase A
MSSFSLRVLRPVLVGALAVAFLLLGTDWAAADDPRYCDRGAQVRSVQNKLIASGYLRGQHNSGRFGALTRNALEQVQRDYGLSPTGRYGPQTRVALRRAVADATGPRTWYHKESIGTSSDGRPITAYRAGERGKPVVVVVATMHGEENFGQYVARGLLEGRKIKGVDLWVVPVLNPDGLVRDRRWVKGSIDLNRNFPHRWISRAHSGPSAASVKETRVIMKFLDRTKPKYLVSWHQPLLGVDSYGVKDRKLMHRLSQGLDLPIRYLDCRGSCHGTMTGWYNSRHRGAAITVEYGHGARSLRTMKVRDANAVLAAIGGRRG